MQNPPSGQPNPPAGSGSTGSGLDPKIAGALSYIWIVGLIFFFIEKENRFVRFHAMQSILFGIANSVIMMVLVILAVVLTFAFGIGGAIVGGVIGTVVSMLVWVVWLIFWLFVLIFIVGLVYAAVKAYQGQIFKLPIIGNMAEKIVNK
ncbi:MAG TPA: hypothetical protein VK208_08220 [Pyrinomonadaceae bacterium]|jgi:uncharacterized membrane protein|nr:hypothetical protein [Pyrinomonadaceae bacterium]